MHPDTRYSVVLAPSVRAQIDAALSWWSEHRERAPGLLARELDQALEIIATAPEIGQKARSGRFLALHRMLLPRTRYHLYYRIVPAARELQVVLFRHAQRRPPV